jgi:hypothetical protein
MAATDGQYSDKIQISWDEVAGATGYRIYRAADISGPYTELLPQPTGCFYVDEDDIELDQVYWYKVQARCALGPSDYSLAEDGYAHLVSEVHIYFTPAAEDGSGEPETPFELVSNSEYPFTAEDQSGADITDQVTFYIQDEYGGESSDPSYFDGNVLHTRTFGFGTYRVIAIYHENQSDEVQSNPDLPGEERYFVVI